LEDAGLTRKILHKIAAERDEVLRTEWKTNIVQNFSGTETNLYLLMKSAE